MAVYFSTHMNYVEILSLSLSLTLSLSLSIAVALYSSSAGWVNLFIYSRTKKKMNKVFKRKKAAGGRKNEK